VLKPQTEDSAMMKLRQGPIFSVPFRAFYSAARHAIARLDVAMLYEFIDINHNEITRRCQAQVVARWPPTPTSAKSDHSVPLFLTQLVEALRLGSSSNAQIGQRALLRGNDLLQRGFTVSQVMHDYGDVCQAITELAAETNTTITPKEFQVLNGCLDDAVVGAVAQFWCERNQSTVEGHAARENLRLGFFAHELRNLLNTAMIAFDVVKSGNVGVLGSSGAVLHRSLVGARDLVISSLAEVRLTQGVRHLEQLQLSQLIEDITDGANLAADAHRVTLKIQPIEDGVTIEADRQVLASVIMNLLQNAFKFTRPRTTVALRIVVSAERALIEIQDECGGLPGGDVDGLFRPFEQRGSNRTGVGLGLAFCRRAVETNHGRIYARNLADLGCVFTIDFPRCSGPSINDPRM
jgi:signal transduction histidine kinase